MSVDISVVVPVKNGERTIRACIRSLLDQDRSTPAYETVVVDNGSTDWTLEILESFPGLRVLRCDTPGPAAARNTGVDAARGQLVAFIDADCRASSAWLAEGSRPFQEPGVVGVAGGILSVEPSNDVQAWMKARSILDERGPLRHPFRPFIQTANAFYRTAAVRAVGGFDESLRSGEDCDLSWRILEHTGGRLSHVRHASVEHDHRATPRDLMRQSWVNAQAVAHLARKWGRDFPAKSWKTSAWELGDTAASWFRWVGMRCTGAPGAFNARMDALHRTGRKAGMVWSAASTGEWSRW